MESLTIIGNGNILFHTTLYYYYYIVSDFKIFFQ